MKSNTKEKRKMKELLKSEDLEMVNLGIQLMKHLCPKKQWYQELLLAFSIVENGRYVAQKWDWQITDEKEINVKHQEVINSWGSYGTSISTGGYWMGNTVFGSGLGTTTGSIYTSGITYPTVTCSTGATTVSNYYNNVDTTITIDGTTDTFTI